MQRRPDSLIQSFINEGYSCFINATLSALAPIGKLVQNVRKGQASSKLCKQLQEAHPHSSAGPRSVRAHCFVKKPFYSGGQEDAHEFFMSLMDDADPHSLACATGERTKERTDSEFMHMFQYEQHAQV